MLWYKAWLDTRWRFVIPLIVLMVNVWGVVITADGTRLTIRSHVTRETFVGAIDSEGTGIVGTFTEGAAQLPLTFRKSR